MGPVRKPIPRGGPQHTLLSGIGVASAVLAGVLVAVTLAAGLLSFDAGPAELAPPRASTEQRVDAQPVTVPEQPGGEPSSPAPATSSPSGTRPAPARPATTVVGVDEPVTRSPRPPPPPPPPPPPQGPGEPVSPRAPLGPVGTSLNDMTDDLAAALREVTQGLGNDLAPLSPELEAS